jgi:hypothetical protein
MYHVCVFRWVHMMASAHEYKVPGIFEYMPLLTSMVPEGEEFCPRPQIHPDGEHVIEGFYPPRDLQHSEVVPARSR